LVDDDQVASIIIPALNAGPNLIRLVESALEQAYTTLEVVVVDGGSTDGSVESLRHLPPGPASLRIWEEREFGSLRGPANARNLGVINSKGRYLFFFDADFELTDRDLISKTRKVLDSHPWVGVRVIPRIDTWLEFHASIDDYRRDLQSNIHTYCGFRREVFEKLMFDPTLGAGEDEDLKRRARIELNLVPVYADAYCERHFIHTFRQWRQQALWHGRTHVQFVRKWKRSGLGIIVLRAGGFLSLLLSAILYAFSPALCLVFLGIFLARIAGAYVHSPTRGRFRIVYLLLRESYWGGAFFTGFVRGLVKAVRRAKYTVWAVPTRPVLERLCT
jgi:glycosyltransferase involved in cell wall biosynthesis